MYNVQHDCPLARCTASGKRALMQERVESGLFKTYIEHRPVERFVINTHAFHNAHLLQATLSRSLVSPVPLHQYDERQAKHTECAEAMRVAKAKRAETKAQAAQMDGAVNQVEGIGDSRPNKRMRSDLEALDQTVIS